MSDGFRTFFSHGCPQAGGLNNVPFTPENFNIGWFPTAGREDGDVVDVVAYFSRDKEAQGGFTRLASEPLDVTYEDTPDNRGVLDTLQEVAFSPELVERVGRGLCAQIRDCAGPAQAAGGLVCTAYTQKKFMKLIMEV